MIRRRPSPLGLFVATLALAAQLVAGALVPQPAWAASHDSESCADMGKAPAHDQRHKPDCPFCPFCLAVAHPAPTLVAPPPPAGLAAMRQGNSRSARLLRRIDPDHDPSMRALRRGYRLQQPLGANRTTPRRALSRIHI